MPKIIWERKHTNNIYGNRLYPFEDDKEYLIYFKGNFGPVHKAHFTQVQKYLDLGPNFKVLINQMKSERHGVPFHSKRKMWRLFIDELLDSNRVLLRSYDRFEDILEESTLYNIDTIVSIRGIEDQNKQQTEKSLKKRYSKVSKKLYRRGIELDFYYIQRPNTSNISATEFTRTLIRTRGNKDSYNKLRKFFPSDLNRNTAIQIIDKLQRLPLKV